MKVHILQRVIANYRVPLFAELSKSDENYYVILYGDDLGNSKVRSSKNLDGVNKFYFTSSFIKILGHCFPWHHGELRYFIRERPDVIICEGDSHIFGYLKALLYKLLFNRNVKLGYWCFLLLPKDKRRSKRLLFKIRNKIRSYFDFLLLYSSYSVSGVKAIGNIKYYIAHNVGHVESFIQSADLLPPKLELRCKNAFKPSFTILYVGTLDDDKNPGLVLELAQIFRDEIEFFICGDGPLLDTLKTSVEENDLNNVKIFGRISDDIGEYYASSDLLLVPGRGGIVISEAMSYSLPVLVHACDGTEYDLVKNNFNGFIVEEPIIDSFVKYILLLKNDEKLRLNFGANSRSLVELNFNTRNMFLSIENVVADITKK